ncbi:MAG TPA: lytic transglycosylase domain-containing protein [Mariprofundaceae bacterium]|nr:lytic transglycosylase domain-containing protein [Mariprofundaceae bacterium]
MLKHLIISSLFIASTSCYAEIYTYKDSNGKFYFTDNQMDDSYRLLSVFRPHLTQQSNEGYNHKLYLRNKATFLPMITAAAKQYQIDPNLLHAIVDTESAFNPSAVSKAGAVGLTQLMPRTARSLGVKDSWNPEQNIQGGAIFFSQLLDKFRNNTSLALAAYNAGETAVRKAGNNIPNYPETIRYVEKVLAKFNALNQP